MIRALVWGLSAALFMLAGGLFLRRDFGDVLELHEAEAARETARWVTRSLEASTLANARLLEHVCTRDIQFERLTLELGAGGGDDAGRVADGLAEVLGTNVLLMQSGRAGVSLLASRSDAAAPRLDVETLERARLAEQLVRTPESHLLLRACARAVGPNLVWVVTATELERALASLDDMREGRLKLVPRDAAAPENSLEVRSFGNPGVLSATLYLLPEKPGMTREDLALLLVVAFAFLLAGALGFATERRNEHHEEALATIERAAERVAQGDLLSAIDTQLGERADRTFRTFDRMTKELRDMRARLAEAEREAAFRDVARRIAHEIKNPLSPIQISIETLRKARQKQRADFDEIFEESTRAILEEVKRLEHIVREFGEFARLPKPTPGEIDLGKLVEDVVPMYVPEGAELTLSLAPDAPRVRADREQITQVLVNLVKNALEAAKGSSPPQVIVSVSPHERGSALIVSDNGPGIAPKDRERVFEPYFTTKSEGTGLGLAIVKRIVSDHGGQITLGESVLGGASVSVSLLAHDTQSTSSP